MKKILAWPAPLLQKWLLSLLLCLPFLTAAIISAFSGDRLSINWFHAASVGAAYSSRRVRR